MSKSEFIDNTLPKLFLIRNRSLLNSNVSFSYPPLYISSSQLGLSIPKSIHRFLRLINRVPVDSNLTRIKFFFAVPRSKFLRPSELQYQFRLSTQPRNRSLHLEPGIFEYYNPELFPYRHLVPFDDYESNELAKHHHEMSPNTVMGMPYNMSRIVLNKDRFAQFLMDHGFAPHVPKFYTTLAQFDRKLEVRYPVVVKITEGSTGSDGVFLCQNSTQVHFHVKALIGKKRKWMIQECVPGHDQRIVHFVSIRGRLVRMVCHSRQLPGVIYRYLDAPMKWSALPAQVPNEYCHRALFERIVNKLEFTGMGNFDSKVDVDGVLKVFEVNPRVAGTVNRDGRLFGEFFCALQWEGEGILSRRGCVRAPANLTTLNLDVPL